MSLRVNIDNKIYHGNMIIEEQSSIAEYYTTERVDPFWSYGEP